MTALDRQFVRLRFAALAIPLLLLFWFHSASMPVTILLAGLMPAYNGVAALAIQNRAVPRFTRPMAVLLLVLDHLVVTGWILLFATPSSSLPYLLYALVAAEAVFRFDLWGGIGTSLFFATGIILFQTSDLGLAVSVRDSVLRAIPTVAVITGLGAVVRAMNTEIRGTRRRLDQTEQLRNVLGELVGQLDVSRMLYTVIRCGLEILQMDSGAIVLLDEERGVFTLRAAVQLPEAVEGTTISAGDGIVGRVVRERRLVALGETPLFDLAALNTAGYAWVFGTPVLLEGKVSGVLHLQTREDPRRLTRWEEEGLEVPAQQLAVALRNVRMFEETEKRARRLELLNRSIDQMNQKLFDPELLDLIATALTGNPGFGGGQDLATGAERRGAVATGQPSHDAERAARPGTGGARHGRDRPGCRAAGTDRDQRSSQPPATRPQSLDVGRRNPGVRRLPYGGRRPVAGRARHLSSAAAGPQHDRAPHALRAARRHRHPGGAPLPPRDRADGATGGRQRGARTREPAQVRVPRQHEPRAAHAAELDPRLLAVAARRRRRYPDARPTPGRRHHCPEWTTSPGPDQRPAGHLQARGGQSAAPPRRGRGRAADFGVRRERALAGQEQEARADRQRVARGRTRLCRRTKAQAGPAELAGQRHQIHGDRQRTCHGRTPGSGDGHQRSR